MDKIILNRFYSLTEAMKKIMFSNHHNHTGGMSKGEFSMLQLIKLCKSEFDVVTTAELSEKLHVSKPAVSQMINVLEKKQYVIREINKNDRRLMSISLTETGNNVLEEEKGKFLNIINHSLDLMGREDSEIFVGLMEKYFEIIKDLHKNGPS